MTIIYKRENNEKEVDWKMKREPSEAIEGYYSLLRQYVTGLYRCDIEAVRETFSPRLWEGGLKELFLRLLENEEEAGRRIRVGRKEERVESIEEAKAEDITVLSSDKDLIGPFYVLTTSYTDDSQLLKEGARATKSSGERVNAEVWLGRSAQNYGWRIVGYRTIIS